MLLKRWSITVHALVADICTESRGEARVFRVGVTGKAAPSEARRAESVVGVFGEGAAGWLLL